MGERSEGNSSLGPTCDVAKQHLGKPQSFWKKVPWKEFKQVLGIIPKGNTTSCFISQFPRFHLQLVWLIIGPLCWAYVLYSAHSLLLRAATALRRCSLYSIHSFILAFMQKLASWYHVYCLRQSIKNKKRSSWWKWKKMTWTIWSPSQTTSRKTNWSFLSCTPTGKTPATKSHVTESCLPAWCRGHIYYISPRGPKECLSTLKVNVLINVFLMHYDILPHHNIIFIYTGPQRLVGQDSTITHNDASFTAETGRQDSQTLVTWRRDSQTTLVSRYRYLSSSSPSP